MRRVAILVLAVLMVCMPYLLRLADDNSTVPGFEQYYHLTVNTESSPFTGVHYVNEPYTVLLRLWQRFLPVLCLPALIMLLSFVLFMFLVRKLIDSSVIEQWVLLVFALSPTFISAGFFGGRAAFALFCILLGCYLTLSRLRYLGVLFFVLAAFSGTLALIAAMIYLLCLMILFPETKKCGVTSLFFIVLVLVFFPRPPSMVYVGFLSDFGGLFGTSVFIVLLAVVAAIILWANKRYYYLLFALLFGAFVVSFFFPEFLVYSNVFACCLAGYSLSWLSRRRWTLGFLRSASLLVLFCGLLFSSVSHIVEIADSPPYPEFFSALGFPGGTVLSYPDYGFWIQYRGYDTVADPFTRFLPDHQSRLKNVDYLFHTNDLDEAKGILAYYNVSYVLITEDMKEGLVWDSDGQGLPFLLKNAETFKRANQTDFLSIYEIIYTE